MFLHSFRNLAPTYRISMDSDFVRQLSLSLFTDIKPTCVELSELALRENPSKSDDASLVFKLRELISKITKHHRDHGPDNYVLSTKMADYIFFPISSILKRPNLSPDVTRCILDIISALTEYSWSHNLDVNLLDLLCPLVIYLCGGSSIQNKKASDIVDKDLQLRLAAAKCLLSLIKSFPRNYFTEPSSGPKRLSILGDTTTILLDILGTLDSTSEESVVTILKTLLWLYSTRVNAEQTSLVFPGVISKVINFSSTTKNLHSSTLITVLSVLGTFISKVFGDSGLRVSLTEESSTLDLHSLKQLLEAPSNTGFRDHLPIQTSLESAQVDHRNQAWLNATSKQLKLSILTFMKTLLFSPSSKNRIANNQKLRDEIFEFVGQIVRTCFKSLFNEVVMSSFDILSAVIYICAADQEDSVGEELFDRANFIFVVLSRLDAELLYLRLLIKTDDLIANQLKSILLSANEEKIGLYSTAVKLHLFVLQALQSNLSKNPDQLSRIKGRLLQTLKEESVQNIWAGDSSAKKANKNELLDMLSGEGPKHEPTNTVDGVELPPHINAKKLGKVKKEEQTLAPVSNTMALKNVSVEMDDVEVQGGETQIFASVYSSSAEKHILGLLKFIGSLTSSSLEELIEQLINNAPEDLSDPTEITLEKTVSLWMSNALYSTTESKDSQDDEFDMDEFLDLDEESEKTTISDEEVSYLLLEKAQEQIFEAKRAIFDNLNDTNIRKHRIYEMAYSVALESIGLLACRLTKEDFQSDVLMEYLHPLLEALTFPADSQAHIQAKRSLWSIVQNYYDGSLEKLIVDNADYLVDSLSLSLSVASTLTPSLPGILLVVLKISGVKLLQANQLQDVLSEMFIVIDSYHGYSALVESFFHVFEEIVKKTKQIYKKELSDDTKLNETYSVSTYKPCGLKSRSQMLQLIDDSYKQIDPFADYDPEKEYFKRKPGVPFKEQEVDSDDEDEMEEDSKPEEEKEKWTSPIPHNLYKSIQQIFTYGLQLLSHPSVKVRIQVLRVLREAYVLMSTSYKTLMPLLAQYWPLLLVLTTGSRTMSENTTEETTHTQQQLMGPALEFVIEIFREDIKHESFMASRFLDMWEFMKKKSPLVTDSTLISRDTAVVRSGYPPQLLALCSKMLIIGMNNYGRRVPDLVAHDMVRLCLQLGIDEKQDLSIDVKNHIWVLRHYRE